MGQYTLELVVRDVLTHPESCLRTDDPERATLFYVPYLPSAEFHNGSLFGPDYSTSPYGQAIYDAIEGNYDGWEDLFGLTSKYWKRRNGSDHILVFSEPLHGLSHPRSRRGNYHFVNTQRQLRPPIAISEELSTRFVRMYPKCASTNVLMPYPNPDGKFLNGQHSGRARRELRRAGLGDVSASDAALPTEREVASEEAQRNAATTAAGGGGRRKIGPPRPLALYYKAGAHGTCKRHRQSIASDYRCTASYAATKKIHRDVHYSIGLRLATFCPCPGGDSPSAKRMFDALLSGCVPVVLSEDFVWPLTKEFDPSSALLDPDDFSLRWNASHFIEPRVDPARNC